MPLKTHFEVIIVQTRPIKFRREDLQLDQVLSASSMNVPRMLQDIQIKKPILSFLKERQGLRKQKWMAEEKENALRWYSNANGFYL